MQRVNHQKYLNKMENVTPKYWPARCSGVEFLPWESLQLIFSGKASFWTLARLPFFAASNKAASPRSRSATSVSPSFTRSKGVWLSRFFLLGSPPC